MLRPAPYAGDDEADARVDQKALLRDFGIFRIPLMVGKISRNRAMRQKPANFQKISAFFTYLQQAPIGRDDRNSAEITGFFGMPGRRRSPLKNGLGQPQFTTWVDDSLTIKTRLLCCRYE